MSEKKITAGGEIKAGQLVSLTPAGTVVPSFPYVDVHDTSRVLAANVKKILDAMALEGATVAAPDPGVPSDDAIASRPPTRPPWADTVVTFEQIVAEVTRTYGPLVYVQIREDPTRGACGVYDVKVGCRDGVMVLMFNMGDWTYPTEIAAVTHERTVRKDTLVRRFDKGGQC